ASVGAQVDIEQHDVDMVEVERAARFCRVERLDHVMSPAAEVTRQDAAQSILVLDEEDVLRSAFFGRMAEHHDDPSVDNQSMSRVASGRCKDSPAAHQNRVKIAGTAPQLLAFPERDVYEAIRRNRYPMPGSVT